MKQQSRYNLCKCGNLKYQGSKKCRECFQKNNRKQISRLSNKWPKPEEISKRILAAEGFYG